MTILNDRLTGLAKNVAPNDAFKRAVKERLQKKIEPLVLRALASSVDALPSQKLTLRKRIFRIIRPVLASDLQGAAASVRLAPMRSLSLRSIILGRLWPIAESTMFHGLLKWGAAFAVLILVIRAMPLLLMAPSSRADLGVQVVPAGEHVSAYAGGVWNAVEQAVVLQGPAMIRTEEAGATILFSDDGVLRLGPHTTVRIHDLSDLPRGEGKGPLATLLRGNLWVLGLVPPFVDGLSLELSGAIASINTGSVGMERDAQSTVITTFDRSATLESAAQTAFLVAGEKVTVREGQPLTIVSAGDAVFSDPWVKENLEQDAVHRAEIAEMLKARRANAAGILPTSVLYPAKRLAEEVDVLFTLTEDGRKEKRIEQANTRLKEAVALLQEGEGTLAQTPLSEYSESLVALALDQDDNLVQHVIREQIAEASAVLGVEDESASESIELLTKAVSAVGALVPEADLKPADIEGYILVDRLARINQTLSKEKDAEAAALAYADIQPYLQNLLSEESGVHPFLQKEALSLLASTSSLVKEGMQSSENTEVLTAMETDIDAYLPPERENLLQTEAQISARVGGIMKRIFIFKAATSRYNQLLLEMQNLVGDPNRGTILRRLKLELPSGPQGLAGYVNTEIHELGDELKGEL